MSAQLIFRRGGSNVNVSVADDVAAAFGALLEVSSTAGDQSLFFLAIEKLARDPSRLDTSQDPGLSAFAEHFHYYLKVMREADVDPVAVWSTGGSKMPKQGLEFLQRYLPEFLSHVRVSALGMSEIPTAAAATTHPTVLLYSMLQKRAAEYSSPKFRENVPFVVLGLPSEANVAVLYPKFEQSLKIPGDVCEFGCFRGVTSLKMAFLLKSLGIEKTVFAFDTFEGFQIADPGGGALGIGAFSDNFDAFGELTRWSKVLPIVPVKGDATKTCAIIQKPLSFVWLDLDMGVLMEPVLKQIMPFITKDTIIGIDDVGRPETPTVEPWVNDVVRSGRLVEFDRDEGAFIRFYRRG